MSNEKSQWTKYIPAILAAVVAIVGIIVAATQFTGSDESWDAVITSVGGLETATGQVEATAVEAKDYAGCVAAKSSKALVGSVKEGLASAKDGTCRIPAAEVDVAECLAFEHTVVVAAPAASDTDTKAAPVEGTVASAGVEVPAAVELAVGPVLALVKGIVANSDAPANAKAWSVGALAWLESGQADIIKLIENPGEGKLSFVGQDIAGCVAK
jgi:hypothetical protein